MTMVLQKSAGIGNRGYCQLGRFDGRRHSWTAWENIGKFGDCESGPDGHEDRRFERVKTVVASSISPVQEQWGFKTGWVDNRDRLLVVTKMSPLVPTGENAYDSAH